MNWWTNIVARGERHLVMTILLLSLASTGVLAATWLHLRSTNETLSGDIEEVEKVLASFRENAMGASLTERLTQAQRDQRQLQAAWDQLTLGADSLTGDTPWPLGDPGATVEGRIDFKVALFNARTNLQELARQNHRIVPPGLGMQETIDADEPAETRLWQLATVVHLLEGAIELGIPTIKDIQPLPPMVLLPEGDADPIGREFPVRLAMECSYGGLLKSLDGLLEAKAASGLHRIYARKSVPERNELLRVQLVYAASLLGMPDLAPEAQPEEESPEPPPLLPDVTSTQPGEMLP